MNVRAITFLICLGVASITLPGILGIHLAAAQSPAPGPGASSKSRLAEVRSRVHDLEGVTGKLRDLMTEYRSLADKRPDAAQDKQVEKWNRAVERLLRRVGQAHAAVVESTQRLDAAAKGELPTSLAKDVANARNDAEATRGAAEQALKSHKPAPERKSKKSKDATNEPRPEPPDSDPLRGL